MEENTPQATVRLLLTRWFAQNGTFSNLQSDKGTQFAADLTPKDVRMTSLIQNYPIANHS